jgi:CRP/FNR family transcriptional regulator
VSKYPVWQEYVFNLVSDRLSDVITTVEEIAFKSVDTRIAEKLTFLLSKEGSLLEITHNELARDIGTSREVVSRILKDFEARGVIQISRGSISVIDIVKLKALQKK